MLRDEYDGEDPLDDGEELLEGCRLQHVGWMRVRHFALWPDQYTTLREVWEYNYRRPPALGGPP